MIAAVAAGPHSGDLDLERLNLKRLEQTMGCRALYAPAAALETRVSEGMWGATQRSLSVVGGPSVSRAAVCADCEEARSDSVSLGK